MESRRFGWHLMIVLGVLALTACTNDDAHPPVSTDVGVPTLNPGAVGVSVSGEVPPNTGGANNGPTPNPPGSTPVGTGDGTGGGVPGGAGLGATGTGFGNNPNTDTGGENPPLTGTGGTGIPITGGGIPGAAGLGSTGIGTAIPSPTADDAGAPFVVIVN